MHGQCEAEDKRGKHAATRHHMVTRHGGTCLVGAELSAVRNVTPRQVSDSQVNNHTSEYNTIPALMSKMVTMISDAANDATTTVGGGGAQGGSDKGEGQHSEQSATQVHDPQRRIADRNFASPWPKCSDCLRNCLHTFILHRLQDKQKGTPPGASTGSVCLGFMHNCECMACLTHQVDADGKSHTPAPNTKGVTELEGLGRANLAKNGKKRKYEQSLARPMPDV